MASKPLQAKRLRSFQRRLLQWYADSARDLPWRGTRDPYRVWISEVMLQQTRVAAVLEHYRRFLMKFPDIRGLARARLSSVLAAWSGLGYYRRARMLHAAARLVAKQGGELPRMAAAWRDLPGVGRYTAAAVASICHGEAAAVVDGNVRRVLGRIFPESGDPWQLADRILCRERPGDFNQAMMELGATVCLPRAPLCSSCPVRVFCATRGAGSAPANGPRSRRKVAYGLALRRQQVWLRQRRHDESLMPGMWELPPVNGQRGARLFSLRHSITDTDYEVTVVRASTAGGDGRWISKSRAAALPLTGLTRKILRRVGVIQ